MRGRPIICMTAEWIRLLFETGFELKSKGRFETEEDYYREFDVVGEHLRVFVPRQARTWEEDELEEVLKKQAELRRQAFALA